MEDEKAKSGTNGMLAFLAYVIASKTPIKSIKELKEK